MKSIIAATAALVAFAASGGVAAAATYDFGLLATNAGVGEGSWDSRGDATNVAGGDFDDDTDRFIVDGIGVTADGYTYSISSIDTAGPHDIFTVSNSGDLGFYRKADAYLDGLSGNKEAGIGVCGSITNTFQCNPSNDDNIGPDGGLDSQNQSG